MSKSKQHITQGQRAVADHPDQVISTILGSCVSCCLWDPVAKVGGMNHMLLAVSTGKAGVCNLVGVNAMELLINDILKLGGVRNRLKAKAFGGAKMIEGLSDIGRVNSEFTLEFLRKEKIPCEGYSFGGEVARHLLFWPTTGRVLQKVRADAVVDELPLPKPNDGNDLELF